MTDDRFAPYSTEGGGPSSPAPKSEPGATTPSRFDGGFFGGPPAAPTPTQPSAFGPVAPTGPVAPAAPSDPTYGAAPVPGFAPPGVWPGQPPARRGLPVWAIVLISVVGGVVLLGILAAIAIPVFLNQRAKAVHEATHIYGTSSLAGMQDSTDPAITAALNQAMSGLPPCGCTTGMTGNAYQDAPGNHQVLVYGAKFDRPLVGDGPRRYADQLWSGVQQSAGGSLFGPAEARDPGRLGGDWRCAAVTGSTAQGQMCVAVDPGAFVVVMDVDRSGAPVDPDFAITARESLEHRD